MKLTRKKIRKLIYESVNPLYSTQNYDHLFKMLTSNRRDLVASALELGQFLTFKGINEKGEEVDIPMIEPDSVIDTKDGFTAIINYVTLGYQLHNSSKRGRGNTTYVQPEPYTPYTGDPSMYPLKFIIAPKL